MPGSRGKLPQWWLDNTPHDTLEEQVERKKKEAAEKKAQEEAEAEEQQIDRATPPSGSDAATPQETPTESLHVNDDNDDMKPVSLSRNNSYRKPTPRSRLVSPEQYESTDYNLERAKLKHVENGISQRDRRYSPAILRGSTVKSPAGRNVVNQTLTSPQQKQPFANGTMTSPLSPESTATSTPSSLPTRQPRHFTTAFTGVSSFDFAMQQRAREQERREKERLAREALARHHADMVEVARASEQKQMYLEEKRKKKEAEENLKGFKKFTLDGAFDKSTELKRQNMEEKRQKKEAEEKIHEYKSTS